MTDDSFVGKGIVSVLIPLYRHEATVEAALDSVLLSDTTKIELIVSDDASTDSSFQRTEEWIQRHGERFYSVLALRQPRNLGITGNCNALINAARGEYVTLLASDDELTCNAVDLQRKFLEQHPQYDFVFANVGIVEPDGHATGHSFVGERRAKALGRKYCATFDIVFQWDLPWARLFARRQAFLRLGGYVAEHSFEDRWCALKIVQDGRFGYLHHVVHLYRKRSQGTGTAGIPVSRLLADLYEVECRLIKETSGLLRALLWIHTRSGVRQEPRWLVSYFCSLLDRFLGGMHRLLLRDRPGAA